MFEFSGFWVFKFRVEGVKFDGCFVGLRVKRVVRTVPASILAGVARSR